VSLVAVVDHIVFGITGANSTVTCAGTVKAPHGAGLVRTVAVYQDNDPTTAIATTVSSEPLGVFSLTLNGHDQSEFTVVAKGVRGENDAIVANCGISVASPSGLYIPPPLNNIA
jgi:hypothetical protein